jgi:hypothetical protein
MFFTGFVLMGVAFCLLNHWWIGTIGVLAFSLMELLLSVFFYWSRDVASAIKHFSIHTVLGVISLLPRIL